MRDRLMLWALSLTGRVEEIRDREEGQAVVEYAVLLALILVVSITIIVTLGNEVKTAFTTISNALP